MEVIKTRRSIRKYLDRPVDDESIVKIIDAGIMAPSGSNTQPWRFIIVKSEEMRKKIAEVSHRQSWMMSAPVFVVCVADLGSRLQDTEGVCADEESSIEEVKQIIRDTAFSMDHMVLAAEEMGIGSCIVAWFRQQDIKPILNIPEDKYVVSVITLGYKGENPKPRPRKKIQEVLHYEQW